ncbi:MAG TPA: Uma2 family endonuclease [Kofleriaceae bacterium]|nr:Uma2 family endonuclease [Kofleriaceae bacterium]
MSEPARQLFSFRDYLQLEEDSGVKHEFLDGHVWAMAGGSPDHARIAANVIALLATQLRGRRCAVFDSDLRVRVKATGLGTYPDLSVVCGSLELDPEDPKGHTITNPTVIVEVLSPSTEAYDRGEKLEHYQQIASLQEVALMAHDRRRIDVWRRTDGGWVQIVAERDEAAALASIDCDLPLAEVYRDPLAG